jgi:GMP synthase (glutamine-hydrolysing)
MSDDSRKAPIPCTSPVNVLAVIHGEKVRAGVFGDVVVERGHELEEWSLAWQTPPPRPLDDYGAVLVFGGAMHADQDQHHPWLREENFLLQRLFALHTPLLGVCLGAQLIAKAAHADVYATPEPEIGWHPVELTEAAADDPIFSRLPERFEAFQWHYYTHGLPGGAEELARSPLCTQAFRLGDRAWGIQFHAEVTEQQIQDWANEPEREVRIARDELVRQTGERIAEWNALGRSLCDVFVEIAERVAVPA